jgi:hypothetical protein
MGGKDTRKSRRRLGLIRVSQKSPECTSLPFLEIFSIHGPQPFELLLRYAYDVYRETGST